MSSDLQPAILHGIASYYTSRLAAHGPTARGVDWSSETSQAVRHRQFMRLIDGSPDASLLDLGCGYGDFLRFVRLQGHRGPFVGYDVASSMIAKAQQLNGEGPDRQWRVGAAPAETADFAIASGIFNVKGDVATDAWTQHVSAVLDILAGAGRRGFAFNVLSLASDPDRRRPDLYYADPADTLAYCLSRFGRNIALLQDYGLYEFTVIVRRP